MEKITAIATASLVLAALVFAVIFMIDEFRYALRSQAATGNITSITEEFARFANSEVDGTKPVYRYRYTYTFDADGRTYHGEETTESSGYSEGDLLAVQYIPGTPDRHRILTPYFQMFRIGLYACILCLLVWAAFSILKRSRMVRGRLRRASIPD